MVVGHRRRDWVDRAAARLPDTADIEGAAAAWPVLVAPAHKVAPGDQRVVKVPHKVAQEDHRVAPEAVEAERVAHKAVQGDYRVVVPPVVEAERVAHEAAETMVCMVVLAARKAEAGTAGHRVVVKAAW